MGALDNSMYSSRLCATFSVCYLLINENRKNNQKNTKDKSFFLICRVITDHVFNNQFKCYLKCTLFIPTFSIGT